MKLIKDYQKVYQELDLENAHLEVLNRRARVKRSLCRLKDLLKTDSNSRTKLKQYYKIKTLDKVKTRSRDLIILPFMVDRVFSVYNGKFYQPLKPSKEALGRYVSEFVSTRKRGEHSKKGVKPVKRT